MLFPKEASLKAFRYTLLFLAVLAAGCAKKEEPVPPTPDASSDSVRTPSGTKLESKEGRFSIYLPQGFPNPEMSQQQVPTEVGEITMHLYTAEKPDGSAFIISYNDYPEKAFVKETERMMDDIREGALRNMNAELESQEDFVFEGNPARSIHFSVTSEGYTGFGRLQYFIAKPRLYQMIYLSSVKSDRNLAEVTNTFTSLRLLK